MTEAERWDVHISSNMLNWVTSIFNTSSQSSSIPPIPAMRCLPALQHWSAHIYPIHFLQCHWRVRKQLWGCSKGRKMGEDEWVLEQSHRRLVRSGQYCYLIEWPPLDGVWSVEGRASPISSVKGFWISLEHRRQYKGKGFHEGTELDSKW